MPEKEKVKYKFLGAHLPSISTQEQDAAAGGSTLRYLSIEEGAVVRVAVAVRSFKRCLHQQYAYLQFKHQGKTVTKYIGKVTSETSAESLIKGWKMLRERNLVEKFGWSWVTVKTKDK